MKSTLTIGTCNKKRNSAYKNIRNKSGNKSVNSYEMSTKNETSILMQNEDDGIYESYSHATRSKDNEDYETPYENDQYEQPYEDHTYAEYEKPKNEIEHTIIRGNKKRKVLFALVIILLIGGLAAVIYTAIRFCYLYLQSFQQQCNQHI